MLKIIFYYIYSLWLLMFSMLSFLSLNFMDVNYVLFIEYELLSINSCVISMSLLLDWMSLLFSSLVMFISSMIVFYSNEYMGNDKFLDRFVYLVLLFVFSMILLILSPNLVSLLLGWDGLGLVSYLLVIYYQNSKSYSAGMITALSNRIGDVALLLSIAWMVNYGDWGYFLYLYNFDNLNFSFILGILIVLAAITKSAQIPFSAWLPEAMAAPTPVSSLVHSSTLVTVGIYLLIRFHYGISSLIFKVLLILGLFTMFMAGVSANLEFDLKKIIALSTLSQLGMMVVILSLGSAELAFFHLLIHAIFKALLFMCAGFMIHLYSGFQDIRFMGGISMKMPFLSGIFILCNLSLCGFPFLSGFYSKDLMSEMLSLSNLSISIYLIYFISIGLTVSYSFRLIYFVSLGNFNHLVLSSIKENFSFMMKSMVIMIIFVILMGSLMNWMFLDMYFIYLSNFMKALTLLMVISGIFVGLSLVFFCCYYQNSLSLNFLKFFALMNNIYFFSVSLNLFSMNLSKLIYFSLDQGWSEYLGGQGISKSSEVTGKFLQILMKENLKILLLLSIFFMVMMLFMF
uniref:NADH-ubiquinone oxidoreductase chain 5 n=1 Tax=Passalidae sp. GENSP02 TaxID=1205572 RepID=A0A0S2MQZ4_9SCAR|nr:NADH deshydrogenase subunit 5 [Passalidae sp. GENSP02]